MSSPSVRAAVRDRARVYLGAYRRVAPIAFLIAVVGWSIWRAYLLNDPEQGLDIHAFWLAAQNPLDPYTHSHFVNTADAYLYAPPFAQLLAPLGALSWPAFYALWTIALGLAVLLLVREWAPLVLLIPMISLEFRAGNIFIFLAVVVAFGFRRPALWGFALLTKPTLGVCLLWFVVRREWMKLLEALVVTALIAEVSMILRPAEWTDWIAVLIPNASLSAHGWIAVPLTIRLPIAAAIVVVAALRKSKIVLPVAATIASPVFYFSAPALLIACVPLIGNREPGDRAGRMLEPVRRLRALFRPAST